MKNKSFHFTQCFAILFALGFCTATLWAQALSGRVYEGQTGMEPPPSGTAKALTGVTVSLYGSNDASDDGTGHLPIQTTITNSEGWYSLTVRGAYDYYNIVQTDLPGYISDGATSVGGTVKSSNWIQYRYADIFITPVTKTGNKFWDKPIAPTNNPPVANDDSTTTPKDTPVDIDVLTNDNDPDSDTLHINNTTDPPHGTVVNHGTHVTYTPDIGYTGTDSFDYTAGDGKGGTDTATVTVTVEQGGEPPAGRGTLDGYKRDADTGEGLENWRIFIDLDSNGEWSDGEPYDMTNSNGYYRINEVEPGTYRVCEEMRDGWEPGGGSPACMEGIDIIAGTTTTQDFHNRRTEGPEPGTGTIRGAKYHDLNHNGQREADEPGLPGWTIFLDSNDNGIYDEGEPQTATDANGNYIFTNLEAGVYRINEVNQTGWQQTDPAVDGEPGYWLIDLEEGQEIIDIGFGNSEEMPIEGQWDFGDAPEGVIDGNSYNYMTTLANNGARHRIVDSGPCLRMNNLWPRPDAEPDGQPNIYASGDDISGDMDEYAAWSLGWPYQGRVCEARVYVDGGGGYVDAWVDFNRDGIWQHPQERIFSQYLPDGHHVVNYTTPDDAVPGHTFARIRINSSGPLPPYGPADDGEVVDDTTSIYEVDYGDAPDPPYPTLDSSDGPWCPFGVQVEGLRDYVLGASIDSELDGQPDADALGDDNDGQDDDDGVVFLTKLIPGQKATAKAIVTIGPYPNAEEFCGWIDFDQSGDWEPSELAIRYGPLKATGKAEEVVCDFTVPANARLGTTYARFTITYLTYNAPTAPDPPRGRTAGEVEDYKIVIGEDGPYPPDAQDHYDFGDSPDSYGTYHNSAGPYHDVGQVMMGNYVDAEPDGQPGPLADADNDDGVFFPLGLEVNAFATVVVNVNAPLGVPAGIAGWIDFDQSGTFEDPGERIAGGTYTGAGVPVAWSETFVVPSTAVAGSTYARFRVYRTEPFVDVLPFPTGYGEEGEVEDYRVDIRPGPDTPPAQNLITGLKFHDLDGDGVWEPADGENGLANWTIWLDEDNDGTSDRTVTTNSQGGFDFPGLNPGTYTVGEQQQSGWTQTAPQAPGTFSVTIPSGPQPTAHFMMFGNMRLSGRDYGDAPLPYPEASHELNGPYLGLYGDEPDAEAGMQRDLQAMGDDNDANGDEENGLLSVNLVKTPGAWSTWELKGYFGSSSDAKFGLWIDFNGDGDWDDSNELWAQFGFCGLGTGPQDWFHAMGAFKLPADAKVGTTYVRMRVYGDCNASLSAAGDAGPGEVEDHLVEIKADGPGVLPGGIVHGYKWNDINGNGLWDILNPVEPPLAGWTIWLDTNSSGKQDAGDMTTQTDAQGHFRFTGVPAGTYALGEQLQPGWTQTEPGGTGTYSTTVQPGQASFPQMFGNRQSGRPTNDGRICGSKWNDLNGDSLPDAGEPYLPDWTVYLDMNQNGRRDVGEPSDVTDAGGSFEFTGLAVGSYIVAEEMQAGWQQTWPGGTGTHTISIQPGVQPACVMFGNTARPVLPPDTLKELDWGDAPDPTYPTLRASNGAHHVIVPGFHLGQSIDDEPDGQPTPDALGDDHFDTDDEDGISFLTPILPGGVAEIEILASQPGCVDAWIDFGGDGSWSQAGDQILTAELLAAGSNVRTVAIPASAKMSVATYARFRLSLAGGLPPEGPAQDGEVEDYHILLGEGGPGVRGETDRMHLKWSQPPLETDPNVDAPPVFCGWNEPARSTHQSGSLRQWRMDADDFRCLGPIPITGIRWWGGYKAWTQPQPPESQPQPWHIGFWANQVESLEPDQLYLERLVWSIEVPNERVHREPVGLVEFPEKPPEMCHFYELKLEPEEWFHQAEFESNDNVFWISITAVYPTDAEPVNQWGWMTRPHIWGRGAVMPAIMGEWPTFDERLFPGRIYPIENSLLCGQNQAYDMCYELLTDQPWIKWDQPFDGIREWQDYSDENSIASERDGGELFILRQIADDWLCERQDPVIAIAWNGSYIGYGYEACKCEDMPRPRKPDYFLLSIWNNAVGIDSEHYNHPGEKIWEYVAYDYDEILVGCDRNPDGEPNEPLFRYSVRLPEDAWFRQNAPENIYWFSVVAVYTTPAQEIPYIWGWTNHSHTFGSVPVESGEHMMQQWQLLSDSTAQPVDMSFTFFTAP